MTVATTTVEVDDGERHRWLVPRNDVVEEHLVEQVGADGRPVDHVPPGEPTISRFEALSGPFRSYERTVTCEPLAAGHYRVTSSTRFHLGIGPWSVFFVLPMRALMRRPAGPTPWWAPPDVLDAQATASFRALASLALVTGYQGTLLTQTLTFAADEFDAGERAQADALATVRVGILLALAVAAWADRRGRRRALLVGVALMCLTTAVTAAAPSLAALTASQTVSRGFTTAVALLLVVVVAEEMPAGSRAYGASLLTMTGALGAGICLWLLPLAEVGPRAWRILFVVPLLFLPAVRSIGRHLPESRRFRHVHAHAHWPGHYGRLVLLGVSALLMSVFTTPASQLQNEFLRETHGFSAAQISLFTMATGTPGGIGIAIGGRLSDVRGRRLVGAVGVVGGVGFTVAMFLADGTLLWVWSVLGSILGGLTVPALTVYGPELFPTSLRTKANAVITTAGVAGSTIGLFTAGRLAERWELGPALAAMAVGPAIVGALILALYPETAHRELEDINPEDRLPTP